MEVFVYTPAMQAPHAAPRQARRLEAFGYDGIAMPDHLFVPNFNTGAPNPYAHGLTVLAACAAVTSRVQLVPLVASNLSRNPVELAHAIATSSLISGGRVELGIGTGWFRPEYEAMGMEFPAGGERIERLTEAVQICRALFRTGRCDLDGRHYRVHVPPGGFVPVGHRIAIMVGGAGPRTIRAAAEVGDRVDFQPDALQTGTVELDEYNRYDVDKLTAGIGLVREVAEAQGRSIPVSESPFVLVTRDEGEGARERRAHAEFLGLAPEVMDRSLGTIIGSGREVAERLAVFARVGCDRVHLQSLTPESPERLAPFLPELRSLPVGA